KAPSESHDIKRAISRRNLCVHRCPPSPNASKLPHNRARIFRVDPPIRGVRNLRRLVWVVAHVVEWVSGPSSIVVTTSAAARSGSALSGFRVFHRVRHYGLRPTLVVVSILILVGCDLGDGGRRNQLKRHRDCQHFAYGHLPLLIL